MKHSLNRYRKINVAMKPILQEISKRNVRGLRAAPAQSNAKVAISFARVLVRMIAGGVDS